MTMTRGNPQLLLERQAIAAHARAVAVQPVHWAHRWGQRCVCVWGVWGVGSHTPRFWHCAILLAHGNEAAPPEDAPTKLPDLPLGTTGEEFRRWCEDADITVCERQREGLG